MRQFLNTLLALFFLVAMLIWAVGDALADLPNAKDGMKGGYRWYDVRSIAAGATTTYRFPRFEGISHIPTDAGSLQTVRWVEVTKFEATAGTEQTYVIVYGDALISSPDTTIICCDATQATVGGFAIDSVLVKNNEAAGVLTQVIAAK